MSAAMFSIPLRSACPHADTLIFAVGGTLVFFPYPSCKIAGALLMAVSVPLFVARWIYEDQPLPEDDLRLVRWHLRRFPVLAEIFAAMGEPVLTCHVVREMEMLWRWRVEHGDHR
ncbi:hypothetical protein [Acidithiobacillus sp.]|uniref:hypothetical protein n=1 Tax=Acidithiobacillus sp. TaxID=1872118 RepID=UPI003D067FB1